MSSLYRYSIGNSVRSDGVYGYLEECDSVIVDGKVYAKHSASALMEPAVPDWCASVSDAKRMAARRLRRMSDILIAQAARLTEEADHAAE